MNTKGVEDGIANCNNCGRPLDNGWRHSITSGYGDFATLSCSAQTLDQVMRNVRPATPEELTAQAESYGKNYKPGPRQAVPFMPSAAVPVEERTDIGHDFSTPCGELDEVFIENASVHIERMDDMCFWIGIDSPGKHSLHIRTGVEDGVWWFSVEEDALSDGKYLKVERPITPVVPERTAEMQELMGRLRELATRATPGPWHQSYLQPLYVVTTNGPHKTVVSAAEFNEDGSIHSIFADDKSQAGEDVRFIAAASPENILKLLDHIEGKAKAVSQEVKE